METEKERERERQPERAKGLIRNEKSAREARGHEAENKLKPACKLLAFPKI